jgi:hypothetical protein
MSTFNFKFRNTNIILKVLLKKLLKSYLYTIYELLRKNIINYLLLK